MIQRRKPPVKILFVCVGNACRSQMAEAWARHLGRGKVQAFSAGSHPYGSIVADTYAVMDEKGISLETHCSKGLQDIELDTMDVVVGMGTEVVYKMPEGFKGRVVDWNIPDPFTHDIEYFRDVRDMIEERVRGLLAEVASHHSRA
jgi:arsenate reductase (thioredoxin)